MLERPGLDQIEVRQGYLDVSDGPVLDRLERLLSARDLTVTSHAPHIDCAMGKVNDRRRQAAVEGDEPPPRRGDKGRRRRGGHLRWGSRRRYPDRVQAHSRERAFASVEACADHAATVGVPLCLENNRGKLSERRHTVPLDRLAQFLTDLNVDSEFLRLTLDVGHTKASGVDRRRFVERFGDRIYVVHLHDDDGSADQHAPLRRSGRSPSTWRPVTTSSK